MNWYSDRKTVKKCQKSSSWFACLYFLLPFLQYLCFRLFNHALPSVKSYTFIVCMLLNVSWKFDLIGMKFHTFLVFVYFYWVKKYPLMLHGLFSWAGAVYDTSLFSYSFFIFFSFSCYTTPDNICLNCKDCWTKLESFVTSGFFLWISYWNIFFAVIYLGLVRSGFLNSYFETLICQRLETKQRLLQDWRSSRQEGEKGHFYMRGKKRARKQYRYFENRQTLFD